MNTIPFVEFPKLARFSREAIVTEKIDGTNAQIRIEQDGTFLTGSRTKWIAPESDNAGFSRWAHEHKEELMTLGPGSHFGEWWGAGIQRNYGLKEKRFSLFNASRWVYPGQFKTDKQDYLPACCHVVPVIWRGNFDISSEIYRCLEDLARNGSKAAPGFMYPEGIVIFHLAGNVGFKKTLVRDEAQKGFQ